MPSSKVVLIMPQCFLYVHIKEKYGQELLPAWAVKWIVDRKDRPLIRAHSSIDGRKLGVAAPLLGWISDASSVVAQKKIKKKKQDATEKTVEQAPNPPAKWFSIIEAKPSSIPKAKSSLIPSKAIANTANIMSDSKIDVTKDLDDLVDIPIQSSKGPTRSETEASLIDNEGWALVDEGDFSDI
ncbi:hypothetical protein K458DRAFT_392985 [Lentithecium fluviatile CBS 122367]|uniref:Uncharacterized protein n=1 Tax=Lentithecium fluviatile CBS 122367 TaxID=1168545 RepID=A0A6G1IQ15_9PLEO|nr:hypothetical protein K458DRAFT_392985 [Lentithecium fluviatile CBS 122367]